MSTTSGPVPAGAPTSAVVLLVHRDGRILLHLRDDDPGIVHPGLWGTFGGSVEPGETPEQCARREVLEETGLALGTLQPLTQAVDREGRGAVASVFYAEGDFEPAAVRLAEGRAVELFTVDELQGLPMVPFVRAAIRDVLVPLLASPARGRAGEGRTGPGRDGAQP